MNKKILHFSSFQKKSDDPDLPNLNKFDCNVISQALSANTLILMKHWIM